MSLMASSSSVRLMILQSIGCSLYFSDVRILFLLALLQVALPSDACLESDLRVTGTDRSVLIAPELGSNFVAFARLTCLTESTGTELPITAGRPQAQEGRLRLYCDCSRDSQICTRSVDVIGGVSRRSSTRLLHLRRLQSRLLYLGIVLLLR